MPYWAYITLITAEIYGVISFAAIFSAVLHRVQGLRMDPEKLLEKE